jgi:UPF0755 protein
MLKKKKKEKNNPSKNAFVILMVAVILFSFIYSRAINGSAGTGDDQDFLIERGDSVSVIAENLKEEGLIKSKFVFKAYVRLSGKQSDFKEGLYVLNPEMNVKNVVEVLTPRVSLKPEEWITFVECWSLNDYARALDERGLISADEFLDITGGSNLKDYSTHFSFLKDKPEGHSLEGYLFPDTYRFFHDSSPDDIVKRILSNFDKKLSPEIREEIERQGKSIHEIITMASIIEKEVRSNDDMRVVSGIFWNRINNRQALESCATLAYILGENKDRYSYEDTRVDSPYNTYMNRGLPPGPIASPGIRAIQAAVYPEDTNYNYFLTDSETFETIFSRTYEEHLRNRNKHIR